MTRGVRGRGGGHRKIWWAVGALLGSVLLLGMLSGLRLARVVTDLRHARDDINGASADIEQGRLAQARTELARAEAALTAANARLYNAPDLDVVGWMPIASQNLESLRSSVGVALRLVHGGNTLLSLTRSLESPSGKLEVPLTDGTIPLEVVQQVRAQSQELAGLLPGVAEQPSSGLLAGPVADLQRAVYQQAARRRAQLDNVGRALLVLGDMAGGQGDRRFLIAVANPAEMRGAGGMVLSYGVLESKAGTFTLGDFGNIDDLFLDTGVDSGTLRLPADFLRRWGTLEPTRLWRNATVHPDFELDAPILEAMFTKKTGLPVDGVIQIDPAGLAAIMVGTGPVEVDGLGAVTADNVVDLTINRAYIDVPDRDQRQELLSAVAKATFKRLVGGHLDSLRPLGEALFRAATARHISFFSNNAPVEEQARFFNASGSLPSPSSDYALLTVQNFSKNKLDYYIDTSVQLAGDRPAGEPGRLQATVSVANTAPVGGVASYVFGPNAPGEEAGLYRGKVSLYLPDGTSLTGSSRGSTTSAVSTVADGGRTAVTFDVELRAGEAQTVTLDLSLAPRAAGPYSLRLVAIGRVRPTSYSVDVALGPGGARVRREASPLIGAETIAADTARG